MTTCVGQEAPDFEARAFVGGDFTSEKLSNHRGKWVALVFYPGDFTFVCPTEVAAVASKHDEFQALGVDVLSLSIDSVFTHKIWLEQELSKMVKGGGIPFAMLSDERGQIGIDYGIFNESEGVNLRATFLVDPEGVIQSMEVLPLAVGRNIDELIRQIRALQYVRATGELTPCAWQPAQAGLKPTPDLVGQVWKHWKVAF